MDLLSRQCAQELLEVVPLAMKVIRAEMRSRRTAALTVAQFRALVFVDRYAGSTLSALSDHLGRAPATVSKMIDGMVSGGLIVREVLPTDRRKVNLALTAAGRSILATARRGTLTRLSALLAELDSEEREMVRRAMTSLRRLFGDIQSSRTGEGELKS
jgi:DNA-binding MarR family transcriptional regulator